VRRTFVVPLSLRRTLDAIGQPVDAFVNDPSTDVRATAANLLMRLNPGAV
jgi:hypothetical protein